MKKRLAIGLSLLAVALSSLVFIFPTWAANTHGHQTVKAHPKSVFAIGTPGWKTRGTYSHLHVDAFMRKQRG